MDEEKRTIEEVAATIAHEVKNPLALLQGYIDLLEAGDKNDSHTRSYTQMRREIKKINEMMLDFTYLAAPRNTVREEINIGDALEEAIKRYKPAASPGVELVYTPPPEEVCVFANKREIEVVFNNLLKNALEAVGDSGRITAEIKRDSLIVIVTIADNGESIRVGDQVFRQFYTTKATGSGLGLYICESIVKAHGGEITLENAIDGGAIAKVILPVEDSKKQ